jgi:hypothetical protein
LVFEKNAIFYAEYWQKLEKIVIITSTPQVHDRVVCSDKLSDRQKSMICERLAVNESRLLDGANEFLQVST